MIGDQVIIFCYEYYSQEELTNFKPTIVKVDEKNRIRP
jgi:aspartate 1-decarboxylase